MVKIVQKDNKILRKIASPVPASLFGTEKLKKILSDMNGALQKEEDGVAIAAPQIGLSFRIFVISGQMLNDKKKIKTKNLIFINPEIIKRSREKELMDEGCLSVRWFYGLVKRSKKITIKAQNEKGNEFVMSEDGLLAQIFQHETDHLDGILFSDKAKELVELPPDPQKKVPTPYTLNE
jgi:peptide deformylase